MWAISPSIAMSESDAIAARLTIDFDRKPVLYQADGRPLVRQAGFSHGGTMAIQVRGTTPKLMTPPKKGGGKKGARKG